MENSMLQKFILILQRFLSNRYNKRIVEIQDPFRDMRILLAAKNITNIVDAGAYVGDIAKIFLTLFPDTKIYAFEPANSTFLKLKSNTKNYSNIKPRQAALSSRRGIATLYINKQNSTNALSEIGSMSKKYLSWQTETISTEKVQLLTLDSWIKINRVKSVEILKMDVQGHELELLKGAVQSLKSSVRLIYTKVRFVRIYKKDCLFSDVDTYLNKFGFKLFQIYNLTIGNDRRLITGDAIFVHEDRVVL
jgi:FkbM family methyltransferase